MLLIHMTMKKTFIICLIAAALASCETPLKFEQNYGFIDYAAFPGMFLTESNSVSFEYLPVASLYAEELTGQFQGVKKKVKNNEIYGEEYEIVDGNNRYASPQSALAFAIERARDLGGNGIINLHIQRIDRGYSVTGMVIKRK